MPCNLRVIVLINKGSSAQNAVFALGTFPVWSVTQLVLS
jgi:hypothetical protein